MTWFCCCRREDDKKACQNPATQGNDDESKMYSPEELKKHVISKETTSQDDGSTETYEDIRKYDEQQLKHLQRDLQSEEARKNVFLAEKVYYPPTERRGSRIPLEKQRAEASRLQSVGKQPEQERRQSLLETSRGVGQVLRRESVQKQHLYELLAQKPAEQ